ncbi:hypothetical protein A3H80_02610 [Candidatus Roizmanbacteria bacterium RIFCSPLOWO2_02_FULL_37_19]|uniref:riboflavin kinase n=1 Tax=Candidatus Roizmanbacteria bacterium RIFCSPHIGHO2_02_FULL_37_24 TaxID=1802037 RepID=A0A1F7H119_9BACT|nr:MAG: hypothetical protein A2862_02315 [Candidatus Roizmanbacteria bacterium RIFCSPHIGHO2_01_FULL_38_41]OGK24815.1 MAG: hypothetical protein A3C24_00765 [Candidatus Roizmanbacteria bacterium RIFCSPHIGHO2_02_FULL_37_24]OGK32787.1 MAG: hypothetical protein A3E10_03270 [Candidatus Roizmanbacteria bacterium RIFCSPHIGHO2_12_FULL_37_23]OGK45587.1 MAG: hypothetical protein A2956_02760 [Candidatus Roizmanbacteria bacterium RIFCSPLOWO2_01_FULL_37_57]OGK53631.1 MAG: hypothetical protein A3H80_02610 [Ca
MRGTVLQGEQSGRTIGFPTVNLDPSVIPQGTQEGIYAVRLEIYNQQYKGVLYFGPRLVKDETNNVLEIYILDFNSTIYGEEIEFSLAGYVRGIKNFGSMEELKEEIQRDVEAAKKILSDN